MKLLTGNLLHTPDVYSQELHILREAERFRRLAVLAWGEDTIYPKSEFRKGSSEGQCGVTNFGFGLWLAWMGVASPDRMFFEEGKIVAADGSPVGDDHTWLRIDGVDDGYTHPDLSMRFDLAGDQFPTIDVPEVVQYDDYFYPDSHRPSGNRVYVHAAATCLSDYNINRFAGRLERFMRNVYAVAGLGMPPQDLTRAV